jgi:beta-lactamase superfamily II metal-dependent hydrolase
MAIKSFAKPMIIVVASTAILGGLGNYVWEEEHRPPILEIYIFALGSGRSMFIRTPEDRRILIDGGANSDVVREITKILPFYSRRIDMIMATNTEGKNVSGLIDVIGRYNVERTFVPAVTLESLGLASSSDQIYSTFTDTLNNKNIETEKVAVGRTIDLDSRTIMRIVFPYDAVNSNSFSYSKASPPEILFNVSFGSKRITFLGNASNKVQKYVASSTPSNSIASDVLIVSHSALPANIAPLLIEKLKPDYLVYSKTISNKSPANSNAKSKKKEIVDPLAYLETDNKFNLKEKGSVKITVDLNGEIFANYMQ